MKPMDRSERTALNVDMVPGTLNVYNFGGDITTNLTYFTFKQNLIGRSRFYSELTDQRFWQNIYIVHAFDIKTGEKP